MTYTNPFKGTHVLSISARLGVTLALLLTLWGVAPASPAHAGTVYIIDVDNIDDDEPASGCTLREAIEVANEGRAGGTYYGCKVTEESGLSNYYQINLPAYTYTLTGASGDDANESGDLDVAANVIITGKSSTIDGGGVDRVFDVGPVGLDSYTVRIESVTIQNGSVTGGGGGIRNDETLYIADSVVLDNESDGNGGGIYNNGTLTVQDSDVYSNTVGWSGLGGGIYNEGQLTVVDSQVYNHVIDGSGGGIANVDGDVTITGSLISDNEVTFTFHGGGIYNRDGDVSIEQSIISSNSTTGDDGWGGGIYAYNGGALEISQSVIVSNTTKAEGGGLATFGSGVAITITNTTLSANQAQGDGGGIYAQDSSVDLNHVTIADNTADSDEDDSGPLGGFGGGVYQLDSSVSFKNSIVAGNARGASPTHGAADCNGDLSSGGHNLVGEGTGCPTGTADQSVSPTNVFVSELGPLADNGGDTLTHALIESSLAIDDVLSCSLFVDQRGESRPQHGDGDGIADCDVGAYELVPTCYTLTTTSAPELGGSVSADPAPNCGGERYIEGTVVTLTAEANAGYTFDHWSGDGSGSDDSITVTMDGERSVTANFELIEPCYALTTTVDPAEGGSVIVEPTPNCAGGRYTEGTVVTLTAEANAGYIFDGWSGDISGSDDAVTVTMDAAMSVTAHFAGPCYTLETASDPAAGGSVSADPAPDCVGGRYTAGTVVTLTAEAKAGYTFDEWSGDASGFDNPTTVTMDDDRSVTAYFSFIYVIDVTTTTDTIDAGILDCATIMPEDLPGGGDGETSLREAICAANNHPGADGIILPTGVFVLSKHGVGENANVSGDLDIRDDLTLVGESTTKTVIDGDGADRVFHIDPGMADEYTVEIADVRIQHGAIESGDAYGGGIAVWRSTLNLSNVIVYDNESEDDGGGVCNFGRLNVTGGAIYSNTTAGYGGGIYVATGRALTISNSVIYSNTAFRSGGAIYGNRESIITISNSDVYGNAATSDDDWGSGGGIFTRDDGQVTMTGGTLSGNTASREGGGVRNAAGVVRFTDVAIVHNRTTVDGGAGGGVNNSGVMTVTASTICENTPESGWAGEGGGIYNEGQLTIVDSEIRSHTTYGLGGGIVNQAGSMTITGSVISSNETRSMFDGGGIAISGGAVEINRSAIVSNTTSGNGGGLAVLDAGVTVTVTNSTLSGNRAQGDGGGIYASGSVDLDHATIADNTADSDEGDFHDGGGIFGTSGTAISLRHTIVAGNARGASSTHATADCDGPLTSQGYNLVGEGTGCPAGATGDQSVPPANVFVSELGPLADNGGETWTHALLDGSPAIDTIPITICTVATDQRGVSRPQGSACDVGAFELAACYTLTTASDPMEGGSVRADPAPNCGGAQYTEGTVVTLTAEASAGYTFAHWSGDASGSANPTMVMMDRDPSVTAHFEEQRLVYLPLILKIGD